MATTSQLALIASFLMVGSLAVFADPRSDALAKLRHLPPPTDYSPRDDNDPKIPLLILDGEGASINHGPKVNFDQVLVVLATLPRKAWTQGRLILYYDYPPGISSTGMPPPAAVKQVDADLKAAGIKAIGGGSA